MSLDPTSSNLFLQDPSAARISPDDKSRRLGMKRELSSRSEERGNQKQRRMDSEVFEESGDEENENENDLLVGDESMIEARAGGNGADGDRNKVADPQKGSARGVRACIVCRRLKVRLSLGNQKHEANFEVTLADALYTLRRGDWYNLQTMP